MESIETQEYTALGALEKVIFNLGHKMEPGTLRRERPELKDAGLAWEQLERLAKDKAMRAVLMKPSLEELREVPAPAIVKLKNGQYIMLGAHNDESVMFLDIARDRAVALPTRQFGEIWSLAAECLTFS